MWRRGVLDSVHVLHVSDTHLGHRQYGLFERELDIYDVWDEIVEKALRERVDLVVHSGDLFDTSRPPPQAIRAAIRGLRRLREAGIPVVAVMGDHDIPKRRQLPPNAVLEDLGLLRTLGLRRPAEAAKLRTRSGAQVYVAGVSNQRGPHARQRLLEALRGLARPPSDMASILVLHQTLQEVAPDYELSLGELPRGYSYYALGHVHLHRGWRLGDSYAAYPGSPEALRLDEAKQQPRRLVLLAEVVPSKTLSLGQLELERPRPQLVYEIEYRGMEELQARLREIRGRLAQYPADRRPILHLAILNVPRGVKTKIYQLAEQLFRSVTLTYRLRLEVEESDLPTSVQATRGQVSLEELLRALLRDPQLVELAHRIIDVAGSGDTKRSREEEILSLIKEAYGIEESR
jgi:exonuclease SbcD